MRQVMVRYTVKQDQAEENARLIGEVFAALSRTAPEGLTYSAYVLEDGVSFVHVASMLDAASNPLQQLPEFKAFTAGVKERCEVQPVTTTLREIGSYSAEGAWSR
ncbi:MAG TPA: hypothetical protein VGM82_23995 [Gemmatimonadaceae bacterium]|jgi:hypothetical protein